MKWRGFSEWRAWSNAQWAYAASITLLLLAAFAIVIGGISGAPGSPDDVSQRIVDNSPTVTEIRDCYVDRTELNSSSGGDDQYFLCRVLFAKGVYEGDSWHDACFRLDDSDGKIYDQTYSHFARLVTPSEREKFKTAVPLLPVDEFAGDCSSDQSGEILTDGLQGY